MKGVQSNLDYPDIDYPYLFSIKGIQYGYPFCQLVYKMLSCFVLLNSIVAKTSDVSLLAFSKKLLLNYGGNGQPTSLAL